MDHDGLQIIPRVYQALWNDEKSGMVILAYGDVGIAWDVRGEGFYRCTEQQLRRLYADLGIDRLEGYVSLAHVKLMEKKLNGYAIVRQMHPGTYHGKPSMWVSVDLK